MVSSPGTAWIFFVILRLLPGFARAFFPVRYCLPARRYSPTLRRAGGGFLKLGISVPLLLNQDTSKLIYELDSRSCERHLLCLPVVQPADQPRTNDVQTNFGMFLRLLKMEDQ
jgi:hypothetical protein